MNRPFKFRVWCKDFNEWEKDYILLSQSGIIYHDSPKSGLRCIRQDSHIVQFFTGLTDKNGKEIFEGDILSGMYGEQAKDTVKQQVFGEVIFSSGAFEVYFPLLAERKLLYKMNGNNDFLWVFNGSLRQAWYYEIRNLTIVGNIFENPDLLKHD